MAQEITGANAGLQVTDFDGRQTAADQTTTTGALDHARPRQSFEVTVYQKTFTAGTGTLRPYYELQVADDSAFTSNLRRFGLGTAPRASRSVLCGKCYAPDGGKRYSRIVPTLDGTDTVNFDVVVSGS